MIPDDGSRLVDKSTPSSFAMAPEETAIFVVYDDFVRRLNRKRLPLLPTGIRNLLCVGFPTHDTRLQHLSKLSEIFQVRVEPWPTPGEKWQADLMEKISARSDAIELEAPESRARVRWQRFKSSERVYFRLLPLVLLEEALELMLSRGIAREVLVPWRSDRTEFIERPGFLRLDASAHAIESVLRRVADRHHVPVTPLLAQGALREEVGLAAQRLALSAARGTVFLGRSIRGSVTRRISTSASAVTSAASIGFVVGGASQWQSLRKLIDASTGEFNTRIYCHDILRVPTSYKTLRNAKVHFTPLEGTISPVKTTLVLVRALKEMTRIRRELRRPERNTESARLLDPDLAGLPDLEVYYEQLVTAVRRDRLQCLVTANCADPFLSVTTQVCRSLRIAHVVIQNAAVEKVKIPLLADCDVYCAASRSLARFFRENGAIGRVDAIGLPYYDTLVEARRERGRGAIVKRYPGLRGKKIVGITTQTELLPFGPIIEEAIRFAEARSDVGVVIKLHPLESASAYADLGDRLERQGKGGRMTGLPFQDFVVDCDVLLSGSSATLLWALVMGVRTVACVDSNRTLGRGLDFMRPEATPVFSSPRAAIEKVARILDEPADTDAWRPGFEAWLDEFATGADGHASQRILALLEGLV